MVDGIANCFEFCFFTFHKNSRIEEKELETGIRGNNGKAQSFNKNNAMSQTVKFL